MQRSAFEKLEIYRLAEDLADHVWKIAGKWNSFDRDTIGKQIVRAADSIGANIAEGHGRGSKVDHRRFLRIARGSTNETMHWLRRAYKRKLLSETEIETLKPIVEMLPPKLNAYLRTLESSINKQTSTSNKQQATSTQHGNDSD